MTEKRNRKREPQRERVYWLYPEFLIDVLNWADAPEGRAISLPRGAGLPEGARAVAVFDDPIRRAIGVVFSHESFDIVKPGERMPEHAGILCDERMVVKGEEPVAEYPDAMLAERKKK